MQNMPLCSRPPGGALGAYCVGRDCWAQPFWRHTTVASSSRDPCPSSLQARPLVPGHDWWADGCMERRGGQGRTAWRSIHNGSQAEDCQRAHMQPRQSGSLKRPAPGSSVEWNNAVPADPQLQAMQCHSPGHKFDHPEDSRITLLFDLNGTLTTHTSRRRSAGRNRLRPGLKELLRLKVGSSLC